MEQKKTVICFFRAKQFIDFCLPFKSDKVMQPLVVDFLVIFQHGNFWANNIKYDVVLEQYVNYARLLMLKDCKYVKKDIFHSCLNFMIIIRPSLIIKVVLFSKLS